MIVALTALACLAWLVSEIDRHYGTDVATALFVLSPHLFGIGLIVWLIW